jgi:hypothetical protein
VLLTCFLLTFLLLLLNVGVVQFVCACARACVSVCVRSCVCECVHVLLTCLLLTFLLLLLKVGVVQFEGDEVDEAPVVERAQDGVRRGVQGLAKQGLQSVKHHSAVTVVQLQTTRTMN